MRRGLAGIHPMQGLQTPLLFDCRSSPVVSCLLSAMAEFGGALRHITCMFSSFVVCDL